MLGKSNTDHSYLHIKKLTVGAKTTSAVHSCAQVLIFSSEFYSVISSITIKSALIFNQILVKEYQEEPKVKIVWH